MTDVEIKPGAAKAFKDSNAKIAQGNLSLWDKDNATLRKGRDKAQVLKGKLEKLDQKLDGCKKDVEAEHGGLDTALDELIKQKKAETKERDGKKKNKIKEMMEKLKGKLGKPKQKFEKTVTKIKGDANIKKGVKVAEKIVNL
ncbi:MAG: hypothetical protein AAFX62_09875 [Pseudomonadota bacterium]